MTGSNRDLLKTTFDRDAELYDRSRPHYPPRLFEDLIALAGLGPGSRLLEVGCGTGRATVALASRGFDMTCVELGENLAAVARRNLSAFPRVKVVVAPFEGWDADGETFDLVYAATSWHWIDPGAGYPKAADLLGSGGTLAIIGGGHAFPADADSFFREIQPVYEAIGEGRILDWPLPDEVPDMRDEIEATGRFDGFQSLRYVWEQRYTANEYIDLLNTFSGHIAMEPGKRDFLYRNIRERIEARPDRRVRRHWLAILNVARKRSLSAR
jgi:SAM-dependent methyltransferase